MYICVYFVTINHVQNNALKAFCLTKCFPVLYVYKLHNFNSKFSQRYLCVNVQLLDHVL